MSDSIAEIRAELSAIKTLLDIAPEGDSQSSVAGNSDADLENKSGHESFETKAAPISKPTQTNSQPQSSGQASQVSSKSSPETSNSDSSQQAPQESSIKKFGNSLLKAAALAVGTVVTLLFSGLKAAKSFAGKFAESMDKPRSELLVEEAKLEEKLQKAIDKAAKKDRKTAAQQGQGQGQENAQEQEVGVEIPAAAKQEAMSAASNMASNVASEGYGNVNFVPGRTGENRSEKEGTTI
jgi:hypothetical protein